jgi:hypothetical protein
MREDWVRINEDLTKEASIDYGMIEGKMIEELYLYGLQVDYKNFLE